MPTIQASETLSGGDEEIAVTLKSAPSPLRFGTPASLVWTATNRGTADLTFPALAVTVDGPAKDKVGASLVATAVTLKPNTPLDIAVNLEPNQLIFPGDQITVTLSGESS